MTTALPDPSIAPSFYDGVLFKRLIAWVIDTVLIFVLCVLILPFTAFTGIFFFVPLMIVMGLIYRWFTISSHSSTWGMRFMAVELRDHTGARLSSQTALWHSFAYTVSITVAPLQLISVAMMLLSPRKQGLGDHLLGTALLNRQL